MQENDEAVLERQTLIGKFLDRLNYRPLRSLYTKMNNLLQIIDRFLSVEEGNLSSLRSSLLSHLSLLSRTFYQTTIVGHLRDGESDSVNDFKHEVERAFVKGVQERQIIVERIEQIINRSDDFTKLKEQLNNKWQELYYKISPETSSEKNIRQDLELVLEKNEEYIMKFQPQNLDDEFINTQSKLMKKTTELSFSAADLGDKIQMILHELLELSINPIVSVFEDEVISAAKIISQLSYDRKSEDKVLADDEMAKLCDVLSWGLDDLTSFDDLINIGKQLRNEYASLLSDFLVYLVDIDLGIQEIESMSLEKLQQNT